ncbi:ankyrin [Colletotrichum caudatum]|nr:ankyrin [Colletotrichum caudatum]
MFLSKGANVNLRNLYGRSALSQAVEEGRVTFVQMLLETGQVDVNSKDNYGQSVFWWAAFSGRAEIAQILFNTGQVDVDSRDNGGRSLYPLNSFYAPTNNNAAPSRFLKYGVDINSKDKDGATPISWAAREAKVDAVRLLLLQESIDPDTCDNTGRTPLAWVAGGCFVNEGCYEKIASLLLATKKVHVNSEDEYGYTPLMWALRASNRTLAQLLVQSGGRLRDTCTRE